MKRLYWRPQRVSLRVLLLVALLSIAGLVISETMLVREKQPFYNQKMDAARLTERAFEVIKEERLRLKIPLDPDGDPAQSGLIGQFLSEVTTNRGYLPAKQTSVNPNFAAVIVHLLRRAGVEEGDVVAVGLSGSFPAINMATYAAIESLKLRPIVISSVASSQWGSNLPKLMWVDMERVLAEKRIFTIRSGLASLGGIDDRALGISRQGRELLNEAITRNNLEKLVVKNSYESIEKRVQFYQEAAGEDEIKVYINVGGGTTSVGPQVGKKMFRSGLNKYPPRGASDTDSVMVRFSMDGVPVIHLSRVNLLASRYGLPVSPTITPKVGEGKIFFSEVHNRWLVAGVLLIIMFVLFALVRLDWGYRMFTSSMRKEERSRPEQMV